MMLTTRQMEKYANVLMWALNTARTGRFKKQDIVLLRFDPAAVRFAEVVQAALLDRGLNPVVRPGYTPVMEHNFYEKSCRAQLVFVAPGEEQLLGSAHGSIYLISPPNPSPT